MKRWSVLLLGAAALLLVVSPPLVRAEEEEEEDKDAVGTVIGIDLGTTYSWCVLEYYGTLGSMTFGYVTN